MLQRRETTSRTDREMNVQMMRGKINGFNERIEAIDRRIKDEFEMSLIGNEIPRTIDQMLLLIDEKLDLERIATVKDPNHPWEKREDLERLANRVRTDYQMRKGYERSINRYIVEIHKKFSLPTACIVFVLIGAPLGIMTRRGGLFTAIILSFGFVLIYYLFLIGGEEFADRNYLDGAIAMWIPNFLLGTIGIIMTYQTTSERKVLKFTHFFLKKNGDRVSIKNTE